MRLNKKDCEHEFVFDTSLKMMVTPLYITGVCTKCGKSIRVTQEEYNKMYLRKGKDESVEV